MKVLVTGANGFVGTYLCEGLASKEHDVVPITLENFGCISGETDWSEVLIGVDAVVHLAARVHIMHDAVADPLLEFRKVNVEATKKLAQDCVEAGVSKFIYLSSIKVNGEGKDEPYSEANIPHPLEPYGVSKFEAEAELKKIADNSGLSVICLRPPLIYGKGVRANFKMLIDVVKKKIPLPFKSFDKKRSFLYVENLVDAIIKLINVEIDGHELFLISDSKDLSTSELVCEISSGLGVRNPLFYFPVSWLSLMLKIVGKQNVMSRLNSTLTIDCSKLKKSLNWNPPFSPEEGLKKTLEYEKNI